MEEIWKQIPGFPNYECSNSGRIRNIRTGKTLRGFSRPNGYSFIDLYNFDEKKRKNAQIHRIVATLFVDNPDNLPVINHIDGDKQNNIYTNLEWCTVLQNVRHAIEVLHRPGGYGRNKKPVRCMETNTVYESISEAGRQLGIPDSLISRCCTGERSATRGLHFEFA